MHIAEKIHCSPLIYNKFYFDPKVYFYLFFWFIFPIHKLEKKDKKLLENNKRDKKKIVGYRDTNNKNDLVWCI
jgi:hypothetical protein